MSATPAPARTCLLRRIPAGESPKAILPGARAMRGVRRTILLCVLIAYGGATAQAHQVNLSTARVELSPQRLVAVEVALKGDALQGAESKGISFTDDLVLAPGDYSVRFIVRDNLSSRLGSLNAPLKVTP